MFDCSDLIGKDFQYGGRGPEKYDCYGLAIEVCRRANITIPDEISRTDETEKHNAIEDAKASGKWERIELPQPFCIVAIRIRPPYVSHLGVVLENCRDFIHTGERRRVTIEKLDSPFWNRRIEGYYKWKI